MNVYLNGTVKWHVNGRNERIFESGYNTPVISVHNEKYLSAFDENDMSSEFRFLHSFNNILVFKMNPIHDIDDTINTS